MFVNELSINTCSPRLLKKDCFGGEPAGFQFLFTQWRQTEESWLRTRPQSGLRAGHGLQSRGGRPAFVPGGKQQILIESAVCKQLLGTSREVFGNRASSILNKAGGQVSPKNKRQTHTRGEDFSSLLT